MSRERLEEIKEHFAYCMDNGLLFAEQEEKLLDELYDQAERVLRLEDHVYSYKELMDGLHSFALKNIKRDISHLGRPITDIVISHTEQLQEQNKRLREVIDGMRLHAHYPKIIKQIYEEMEGENNATERGYP